MGMVEDHLRYLRRRNLRPGTITQRRRALVRLGRAHDLARVTTDQLEVWLDGRDLGPEGRATEISHLRGFYRWALDEGRLGVDPAYRLVRPKIARRLPRPMPEGDLAMAVEAAPTQIRAMLMLAGFAGLRACEIAPLRGEDIWWHQDPALIVVRRGKGGDPGTVPVGPVLEQVLRELPHKGWLFPRVDGALGSLKAHSVSHLANEHLHATGSHHTIHSCRHRFGTLVYRLSGGDLRLTQEMMRHRSPSSTAVYTQVDQSHAASVVSSLPAPTTALRVAS